MNYIIRKGSTMARYTKSGSTLILRTPIQKTVSPDARAVYLCAGVYDKYGNPTNGFIEQNTLANVKAMGKECVIRALNPTANEHWRAVTTTHDPETCWYNGAFATSASAVAATLTSCEAYYQMGAYHFTVPSVPSDIDMTIQLKYVTGGGFQCYQSAGKKSASNKPLRGYSQWSSWQPKIAVYTGDLIANYNKVHLRQVAAQNWFSALDMLADGAAGGFKGVRDLWGFTGSTRDGGICTLTTPLTKTFTLGTEAAGWIRNAGGAWLIPYTDMSYGSGDTDYSPSYYTSNAGWWGGFSLWGLSLVVKIGS